MHLGFIQEGRLTDSIFVGKQLQEKYWEINKDLYFCFADLKKAHARRRLTLEWEILFADNLVLKADSEKELQVKWKAWYKGVTKQELKVKIIKSESPSDKQK